MIIPDKSLEPETPYDPFIRFAGVIGLLILLASLFGILTRPIGYLAAFWPANALLLGVMIRNPGKVSVYAWLAAIAGYLVADIVTGSDMFKTSLLTAGNIAGVVTGYLLFRRIDPEHQRLRHPLSVFYLVMIACGASAASGVVGSIVNPLLFSGTAFDGWVFWF